MYDSVIKLVSAISESDEYGDLENSSSEREIMAEEMSIGMAEFYQAQAVGLKPEIKFRIADYLDYHGEKILKYAPYDGTEREYTIIKTYRKGTELEITCKRGVD